MAKKQRKDGQKKRRKGGDTHADECHSALRRVGFNIRPDQGRRHATAGDEGRADVMCALGGMATFVEIKWGAVSLALHKWTEQQREWALNMTQNNRTPVYLWIMSGPDQPHYDPAKYRPRKAWCVPLEFIYPLVKKTEQEWRKKTKPTIPYRLSKTARKRGESICLEDSLSDYALEWRDGAWHFPIGHEFMNRFQNHSGNISWT